MLYKAEVLKSRKRENLLPFILISFLISAIFILIISLFFVQIYKILPYGSDQANKSYFVINVFSKNFRENDYVVARINDQIVVVGLILIQGPAKIQVNNDEIQLPSKKILLKNPLPKVFNKKEEIQLNQEEFYIISETSLDSFYFGKIHKNQIMGKVLFRF
jgi:hypothetical protein